MIAGFPAVRTYQGAAAMLSHVVDGPAMLLEREVHRDVEGGRGLGCRLVSNAELLAGIAAHSEASWRQLVDRFAGLVWSVARSFRLPRTVAEDVVQTVWLRLAEHAGTIREPDALPGWLATTTRREALRAIKLAQRQTPSELVDDAADTASAPAVERLLDTELRGAVLAAFRQLSEHDQQLLRLLCVVPPLDYGTIAELLGRPIGSIGPTRARCLERLRQLLPGGLQPDGPTTNRKASR